jgi:hypothetical protein
VRRDPNGRLGAVSTPRGRTPFEGAIADVPHRPRRVVLEVMMRRAEVGEVVECGGSRLGPRLGVIDLAPRGTTAAARESAGLVSDAEPPEQVGRRPVTRAIDIEHRTGDRIRQESSE